MKMVLYSKNASRKAWRPYQSPSPTERRRQRDPSRGSEKDFAEIDGIKDANSLKDLVKKWATNGGEKYSSRNVINVLLIGQDDGRSDSMILASINKKTDQITLASFFRDSYSYINYNGEDRYTKMNAAYAWGGPELLIETLENNFKVEIDYYVTVNFENFSKAIDAIGGVYEKNPYQIL